MARRNNSTTRSSIGVGVTTLVTIFMVLLLTTFSVLTLALARYDHNLSTLSMQATGNYYAADREACLWLTDVQSIVDAKPQSEWSNAIADTAPSITVKDTTDATGLLVSQSFEIDNRSELRVRIMISDDGQITIIEWRSTGVSD